MRSLICILEGLAFFAGSLIQNSFDGVTQCYTELQRFFSSKRQRGLGFSRLTYSISQAVLFIPLP